MSLKRPKHSQWQSAGRSETVSLDGHRRVVMTVEHRETEPVKGFYRCAPVLLQARRGWLGLTPPEHPYRIGVMGATEAETLELFEEALDRWQELADRIGSEEAPTP